MGKDFNQSVVFFEAIKLMLDMYPHFQKCPLDISLEASNPIGVSVDRLESGLFGIKLFATPDGNCFTKKLFNIFIDSNRYQKWIPHIKIHIIYDFQLNRT